MHLRKNLYSVRFANHNPRSMVTHAMEQAFPMNEKEAWIAFDSHTYLVYTEKDMASIRLMIGVNLRDDIDDFILMQLDFASAMSTFTDRYDIIEFLKMVRGDAKPVKDSLEMDQSTIDRLLDKVGKFGRSSLSDGELELLSKF